MAIVCNPKHYRLTLVNANTEYSQTLTASRALKFEAHLENPAHTFRVSFDAGTTAAGELILQGGSWGTFEGDFQIGNKILYFESPDAGAIVSIRTWELNGNGRA